MPRDPNALSSPLEQITDFAHSRLRISSRIEILTQIRRDPESSKDADQYLMRRIRGLTQGIKAAEENLGELKGVLDKMSAEPWFPATFITPVATPRGTAALVRHGANERLVMVSGEVELESLKSGDQVFLSSNLSVLMALSPCELDRSGELCTFERWIDDERILAKSRDELVVLSARSGLDREALKPGAMLRFSREAMLALELVKKSNQSKFFLEESPQETFDDIGGLESEIGRIKESLQLQLEHQDVVGRYRLPPRGSVLLHGPAGTGKTLVARALASWLGATAPGGRAFFMNIKPAQFSSKWYGQSESNYREAFRMARETAQANPGTRVIMFFDELDSIGGARGASHLRVNDSVLTSFLAELDGLASRGDVLVVGATNRRDMLDPALLRPGRFGDLVLKVPRPNRDGTREIFGKHLLPEIPYARNGHGDDLLATRSEIIDTAVSTIFSQNGESELATITFRDGKQRAIRSADLVSGAVIANISRSAVERACLREMRSGQDSGGLECSDVLTSLEEQFQSVASVLTPTNCRSHVDGMPDDLDVVSVKPIVRRISQPHRFLTVI